MASGIFVLESGRILVLLFFLIGKRVTILLPVFFDHKLAQSLLTMGLGPVVTPQGDARVLRHYIAIFFCPAPPFFGQKTRLASPFSLYSARPI
jgi:hypothetical protein